MMSADECVKAGKITSADQYMIPNKWHAFTACMPLSAEIPMHEITAFVMFIPFFIVGMLARQPSCSFFPRSYPHACPFIVTATTASDLINTLPLIS
jgi:hypothetical protein